MFNNLPPKLVEEILEQVQVGLTFIDSEGNVKYFNKLAAELLGWEKENVEYNSVYQCHSQETHKEVEKKLKGYINGSMWHRIVRIKERDIENVYSRINIDEEIKGIMIISRDVTEREEMNRIIKEQAITDHLTGLYNRTYFNHVFDYYLDNEKLFGVLMADVNGLKFVNDCFGHESGDELIVRAAKFLKESVRDTDYVFRFGGDEFLILMPLEKIEQLEIVSGRIKDKNQFFEVKREAALNISIGYCASNEVDNVRDIITCADERMYEDKKRFYENEGALLKCE